MAALWYYQTDGQSHGPVSPAELIELAKSGTLRRTDYIRREQDAAWSSAERAAALWANAAPASATQPLPRAANFNPQALTGQIPGPPQRRTVPPPLPRPGIAGSTPPKLPQLPRNAAGANARPLPTKPDRSVVAAAVTKSCEVPRSAVKRAWERACYSLLFIGREACAVVAATVAHALQAARVAIAGLFWLGRSLVNRLKKAECTATLRQPGSASVASPPPRGVPLALTSALRRLKPRDARHAIRVACGYACLFLMAHWLLTIDRRPAATNHSEAATQVALASSPQPLPPRDAEPAAEQHFLSKGKPDDASKDPESAVTTARHHRAQPAAPSATLVRGKATPPPTPVPPRHLPDEAVATSPDFDPCLVASLLPKIVEDSSEAVPFQQANGQPKQRTYIVPRKYAPAAAIGAGLGQAAGRSIQFRQQAQEISREVKEARDRWHAALKNGSGIDDAQRHFAYWLTQKDEYYDAVSPGTFGRAFSAQGQAGSKIAQTIGGEVDGGPDPETRGLSRNRYLRARGWSELDKTGIDFPWNHDDRKYLRMVFARYGRVRSVAELDAECDDLFQQFGEQAVLQAAHEERIENPHGGRPDNDIVNTLVKAKDDPECRFMIELPRTGEGDWADVQDERNGWYWAFGREAVLKAAEPVLSAKRDLNKTTANAQKLNFFRSTPQPTPLIGMLECLIKRDARGYVRWIVLLHNVANAYGTQEVSSHLERWEPDVLFTVAEMGSDKPHHKLESLVQLNASVEGLYQRYGEAKISGAIAELLRIRDIPQDRLRFADPAAAKPDDIDLALASDDGRRHRPPVRPKIPLMMFKSDYIYLMQALHDGVQATFGNLVEAEK